MIEFAFVQSWPVYSERRDASKAARFTFSFFGLVVSSWQMMRNMRRTETLVQKSAGKSALLKAFERF